MNLTTILICLFLSHCIICYSQSIHPRNDPNTIQAYKQAKDKGVVVLLTIALGTYPKTVNDKVGISECGGLDDSAFRFMTALGYSLRHLSSKMSYLVFADPYNAYNSKYSKNNMKTMSKSSPCFSKYFKNIMDVSFIESSRLNSINIDVSIVLQTSLDPVPSHLRGNLNVLALSNIFHSFSTSRELSWPILRYLSTYDVILTTDGLESSSYEAMLRFAIIESQSEWKKESYLLPSLSTVVLPLSDKAIESYLKQIPKSTRDISVYIGSFARSMPLEVTLSNLFRTFFSLKYRLFPLYNMTVEGDDCDRKTSGKLHIIGQRATDEIEFDLIANQLGVPKCQYIKVYRDDESGIITSFGQSGVLWLIEDPFNTPITSKSCLYSSIGRKEQEDSNECDLVHSYRTVEYYRELIHSAMALECVPIALHTSMESRNIWEQKILLHHRHNGFIAKNYDDMVTYSQQLLSVPFTQAKRIGAAGKSTISTRINEEESAERISDAIINGIVDKTFRKFVNSTVSSVRKYKLAPAPAKKSKGFLAIIIEPRINFAVEYCIRNVLYHLSDNWGLRVYHSDGATGNEEFLKLALADIPNVDYQTLPKSIASGSDYNAFLKSPVLWKSISLLAERVLLFQSDSLILRRGIEQFIQYDYIGAPWHMNEKAASFIWLKRMQRYGYLKQGVGNGGFSIRNPLLMANISSQHGKGSGGLNEDVFFASHTEKLSVQGKAVFPSRAVAYSFALETPCDDLDPLMITDEQIQSSNIPFAVHSVWSYADIGIANKLLYASLLEHK